MKDADATIHLKNILNTIVKYSIFLKGPLFKNSQKLHLHNNLQVKTLNYEKAFEYSKCKKTFSNLSDLTRHKRTHIREKPFKLSDFNKTFSDKSNSNKHKQLHTGESPFECTYCKKGFSQIYNLIRYKLTHGGEKLFKCSFRKKSFYRKSSLT